MDGITRLLDQHVASLEHDARQPRLAMEADAHANAKTREHTEGAATAVQAMHGDSCSATRVEPGPKTNSTSFGMKAEHPALPCRDGVLVENGDASPKSCLLSLEMRSPSAAGGLLPTGETSTATKIPVNRPPLRIYLTKETNWRTSTVSYYSSFWNLLAPPSYRRVVETKSVQSRTFDPGGFQGRLRTCPFWGSWRRCFLGRFMLGLGEAAACFGGSMIQDSKALRSGTGEILHRTYSGNLLAL